MAQSASWRTKAPYRADQVGSLLRTAAIKDARENYANGSISTEELRRVEDKEIERVVEKQKETGLQAVTDGEFRRAWWHFDFLEDLIGVEAYEKDSGIQFEGVQTKARGIKVTGKIDFSDKHPMLEDFRYLHQITGSTEAKFTIPSPNMLHLRGEIDTDLYSGPEDMIDDLAKAYQKAIQAFYDAGCRYLQLDDTSWAHLCSEEQIKHMEQEGINHRSLVERHARAVNESVAYKPEDMTITMHICRGNFRSTWFSSGGYEPVADILFGSVNVDGFFLEYDNDRAGDFKPLRFINRKNVQVILGLITSKSGDLENADDVKARIREASEYVPLEQLCLSPQCGFASTEEGNILTEDEQWKKLEHVVTIAKDVWQG
ncbi:5-methyltetrahydropteroyltriglutamate--homocysteine S-methyltransferase [Marinococcus halophilus]|uniref:Cobalamin-independent methionine synthase MetE C-terminal/archaeal domain-containing protein n=1 Tax=Marinococcus halophilus TaxID=1371 RepID=A0A510Y6Q9_MARHA|nr:5-methyltetrahydropteroyltriglutamate--homocysteine S-methyltransferase [Marinococcus halophilus]OZT80333.1 5-methyltetrahydropteroyltriglutamate--homocysteine S-methyltransferase [Marinococcus halophilus]GEK58391.1 hypothetical protein MHA01_12960 [Marinococcus halophilus]